MPLTSPIVLTVASPADAAEVQALYAPIVRDTVTSFETDAPGVDEMRRRIETTLTQFPWLLAAADDAVIGFAYAAPYRQRAAYQWTVEVNVYLAPNGRHQGLGRRLYRALLGLLRAQGYAQVMAGIVVPNVAGVHLHESLGFRPVGVCRNAGYKLGYWRDVGWWQLELQAPPARPHLPRPFPQLSQQEIESYLRLR